MAEPLLSASFDPALLATMSEADLAHTLRMNVDGMADLSATIEQNPFSTIEPAQRAAADTQGQRALEGLGAQRDDRGIALGLDIEQTIGEGGMGIVRLATQRSLGRKVAVKTLKPEVRSDAATLRLLREAWVTGSLEHPNIVPVYDLGLDEAGSPIIVLKRIEGVEWGEVMHDASAARDRYGAADILEHNIRILVQLCNAVSLAHARGVLHRDLKPENVMIGSFGEVYLVDWGIAVSLRPDPTGKLPLAAEQTEMAGTPCYMAPEMLGALGKLSELTDVYLLGAILHEILTGAPPHTGTFKQIVGSILLSTFVYEANVPKELAEIARRAMSRQPEHRFASAEELRLRLEWYLRHRGSLAISEEASRRLVDMESLVGHGASEDSAREHLYHLFAECRFGFRQALNASADNETARLGLRRAIETVVRFELDRGAAEAAAGALAEIADPSPELVAQVNAAVRARAAEKKRMQRLERLDAELDPLIGRRTRAAAAALLGLMWAVTPKVIGWTESRWPEHPHWAVYVWTVAELGVAIAVGIWGRESLTKTSVNRRVMSTVLLTFAAQLTLQIGAHVMGLNEVASASLHLLVWGICVAFAASVEPRFWWSTAGYFAAFLVTCRWPERRWDVMSGANFLLMLMFLRTWWRPHEDRPRFMDRRPPAA